MTPTLDRKAGRVIYFAYGSNMSTNYLRDTVPSASAIGRARLRGKKLAFNKRSKDGSGKANLLDDPTGIVWGALFELDPEDLPALDRKEASYSRNEFRVISERDKEIVAHLYLSSRLTQDPRPYEWYKRLVVAGAREHGLPKPYVRSLERIPAKPDPA